MIRSFLEHNSYKTKILKTKYIRNLFLVAFLILNIEKKIHRTIKEKVH